ncbi:MAG: alpha/beta hydrolase [Verrucomicrobia bacterium]|nr:alpha/beta hydrolase [Verrucomicrobiota bacterium]
MIPISVRILLGAATLASAAVAQPKGKQPPPGPPPDAIVHRDLRYVENGHERQALDLYLPKTAPRPLPVIVWVHGGGWQNGSKANALPVRHGLLAKGYAVASLGYRLTDAAAFPAQIQDVKAGIRWLRAHASEYGLDPNRLVAWGSSAGGHLVAMLGTAGDVASFDVGPHPGVSSRVQGVIDFFGPSDLARFVRTPGYESHGRPGSPEAKLIGGTVAEKSAEAAAASPVTYVTRDDAPFLILHGSADPTVPVNQSEVLHAALVKVGVPSELHVLPGAKHGGPEFSSPEAVGWVEQFLQKIAKGGNPPSR